MFKVTFLWPLARGPFFFSFDCFHFWPCCLFPWRFSFATVLLIPPNIRFRSLCLQPVKLPASNRIWCTCKSLPPARANGLLVLICEREIQNWYRLWTEHRNNLWLLVLTVISLYFVFIYIAINEIHYIYVFMSTSVCGKDFWRNTRGETAE